MAFLNFNAANVEPDAPIEVLPAGNYIAIITESDVVMTKSGTGQRLKLTWKVVEGNFANRMVFDGINIAHQNPKAEEIGQRQLSGLCHAANVLNLQQTEQLHGIPVQLKLIIRKDDTGQYGDQNEVKGYSKLTGHAVAPRTAAAQTTPAAPAPQAAPAAMTPPWASNRAA